MAAGHAATDLGVEASARDSVVAFTVAGAAARAAAARCCQCSGCCRFFSSYGIGHIVQKSLTKVQKSPRQGFPPRHPYEHDHECRDLSIRLLLLRWVLLAAEFTPWSEAAQEDAIEKLTYEASP